MSNLKNKLDTIKIVLIVQTIFIVLFYFALLNVSVMINNGSRMPVKTNYHINSGTHFSFTDNQDVEFWYLPDVIQIGDRLVSIGDIGMLLVIIATFGFLIYNVVLWIRGVK